MIIETLPINGLKRYFLSPKFRLLAPFRLAGITVPASVVTDGASIPWFLRAFFSPLGPWAEAAVLHDFLIWSGFKRRYAAGKFREAMRELRINPVIISLFYAGVRIGDAYYWLKEKLNA